MVLLYRMKSRLSTVFHAISHFRPPVQLYSTEAAEFAYYHKISALIQPFCPVNSRKNETNRAFGRNTAGARFFAHKNAGFCLFINKFDIDFLTGCQYNNRCGKFEDSVLEDKNFHYNSIERGTNHAYQ